MRTYILEPSRPLVIDHGDGFMVRFDAHTVDQRVEIRAGFLGPLRPRDRSLDVAGAMYRVGFAADVRIRKQVYVQLPFDARRLRDKPKIRVLLNTRTPQYPDPLPWKPDDPVYPDPLPWEPQPVEYSPPDVAVIAASVSALGTFVPGIKG